MIAKYIDQFGALLFDLDGTLIDTLPIHYRAYAEVFALRGLTLREADFLSAIGAPAREAIPRFLEAAGIKGATPEDLATIHFLKKQIFQRMLTAGGPARLAAAALLDQARGRKKLALVSSGNREGIMAIVSAMGWTNVFDVIISGDDVIRGKPSPEPYLAAAAALGIAPRHCLVFEDTEVGFASGRAAGMVVLDVTKLVDFE